MKKIKGFRTYITILLWIGYESAVRHGYLPLIPEVRMAFGGAAIAFLRLGSKNDAARAVRELKGEAASDAPPAA